MDLTVKNKSRKITGINKKSHHLETWNFEKQRHQKFNRLNNMVTRKADEKITPNIKTKTEFSSNKRKCCWEVKHSSGLTLFKIIIKFSKRWIFSVFSLKKGWIDSEDLSPESLCLAINAHFE